MKQYYSLKVILMLTGAALSWSNSAGQSNMLFSGGALYHDIEENSDIIRSSGYNTITIWSVHIGTNGGLILNESGIVEDGEYIGRPNWPDGVRKLLEAPTSVNRVELSVGSADVPDWENIEALVKSEGTGPSSALYRNFAKLKEVLPEITAINNDDESNYDVETTVAFSKMLIDLGYKITFAPFTVPGFWEMVYDELEAYSPGSVDKVYLQVYAGGSGNDPASWNTRFDIKVTPGLWSYHAGCNQGDSPESMETRMRDWNNATGIDGGFTWLFEDLLRCSEKATVQEYAGAINRAFGIPAPTLGKASGPAPADGATETSVDIDLSWTGGSYDATHSVYFGTSPSLADSDLKGEFTTSFYDPGTLDNNTVYYWRIDGKNSTGEVQGDTWSFTTEVTTPLPGIVSNPSPMDGALDNIRTDAILAWDAAPNAISYDVHFGKEDPPPFIGNQLGTRFEPTGIDPLTTYYWQVNSVNSAGKTTGEIWSYTTQDPNIAPLATLTVSSEFNSAFGASKLVDGVFGLAGGGEWASLGEQTPTVTLTWDNEVTIRKIVLYDRPNPVEEILSGTLEFGDGTTIEVGPLPDNGDALEVNFAEVKTNTVEFRVTNGEGPNVGMSEFEVFGLDEIGGSPAKPRLVSPGNEAVDLATDVTLDWGFTRNATSYRVYLGENSTISGEDLVDEVTSTELDTSGLKPNTTYFWRVDAVNFLKTVESDVSSFTTVGQQITSIEAEDPIDTIHIYPNPTHGLLEIRFQNDHTPVYLAIYSPLGGKILEQTGIVKGDKIVLDLSKMASAGTGIYLVRFVQSGLEINRSIIVE